MESVLAEGPTLERRVQLRQLVLGQINDFLHFYNAENIRNGPTTLCDISNVAYDAFADRDDAVLRIHTWNAPRPHKLDRYYKPSGFGFQTPDQLVNALDIVCDEIKIPKIKYEHPDYV